MIRYRKATDEGVEIEQITNQPFLYIDQWMWSLLSRDSKLRQQFIEAASQVNATIMYSVINLIELSQINDPDQIQAIVDVMDNIDYGFSDANPSNVIAKEKQFEVSDTKSLYKSTPDVDLQLMENFFLNVSNPLDPFRISDIITKTDDQIRATFRKLTDIFDGLNPIILKARADADALNRAKKRHASKEIKRGKYPYTQDIYRLSIDFVVANEKMQMPSKEWRDLLNTVVPVAYFDLVLLDKRWCHFIRTYCPLGSPDIANVFSQSELVDFFSMLINFRN